VFFATAEGLLAADTDHGDNDIYDARIDGGFAETAPPTPACGGSGCQEQQSSTTPAFAVIGSAAAQGQGNLAPPPAAKPKPKPKPKPRCRKHKSSCPRHKAPSAKRKVGAVNHGKPRSAGR
jgi:hypothetical protein